ncbi:hypothetical protein Tsubulata_038884 [Turnera subulata]|uniref:Uncharacterized protein n=1 Tax=Turnera subulata TaxID=218843 RepID=A0A9Q0F7Q2_9ROSI|nr:hypothetical protein Tsubulata_038884 [Turnera subulata]
METHTYRTSSRLLRPPCPLNKTTRTHQNLAFPLISLSSKARERPEQRLVLPQRLNLGSVTRCAKWGSSSGCVAEVEKQLEEEVNPEGENWIVEMGKLRGKCQERKGMVELLECLESEAIMGEDEGRDPNDYNRRAQIFDKSSKVFMALKECTTASTTASSE